MDQLDQLLSSDDYYYCCSHLLSASPTNNLDSCCCLAVLTSRVSKVVQFFILPSIFICHCHTASHLVCLRAVARQAT